MHWKLATWRLNSVTLVIPHSRQEQMQKLKIQSFDYIKADLEIGSRVLKNLDSPLKSLVKVGAERMSVGCLGLDIWDLIAH